MGEESADSTSIGMDIFEKLYEDNYHKLYTLAFRMTGKKEDAEDVLQTAFLNAYKSYESFRQESSFYTWIYRIVINEANRHVLYINKLPVDRYAEEHQLSVDEVFQYINRFGEVEDEVMSNLARENCLQLFMNCMPSKYRIVFTLRVILQFSTKDTAELLEITENAVKVNLHRAKAFLEDLMNGRCSLMNPKNPCKCSAWVKYALETNREIIKEDIQIIRQIERHTANQFNEEMKALVSISELYNTRVLPDKEYSSFKAKIRQLIEQQSFKLLEIENIES